MKKEYKKWANDDTTTNILHSLFAYYVLSRNLISITIWRWNSRSHHVFFVDWFNLVNIKWFDALIKNFVHLIQDFENLNDKWRKNNILMYKQKYLVLVFVHLHTLDLFVPPENQNHTNCKTLSLPHHMNMILSRNWEKIMEVNKKDQHNYTLLSFRFVAIIFGRSFVSNFSPRLFSW